MNVNSFAAASARHPNQTEIYVDDVTRNAGPTQLFPGLMGSPLEHTFQGQAKLKQWSQLREASQRELREDTFFPAPAPTSRACRFGVPVTNTVTPPAVAAVVLDFLETYSERYEVAEQTAGAGAKRAFERAVTCVPREYGERLAGLHVALFHGNCPVEWQLGHYAVQTTGMPCATGSTAASLSTPRCQECTLVEITRTSGEAKETCDFVQALRHHLAEHFGYHEVCGLSAQGHSDESLEFSDASSEPADDAAYLAEVADAIVAMQADAPADGMNTLWQLAASHAPSAAAALAERADLCGAVDAALRSPGAEVPLLAARALTQLAREELVPAAEVRSKAQLCAAAAGAVPAAPSAHVAEALVEACVRVAENLLNVSQRELADMPVADLREASAALDAAVGACNSSPEEDVRKAAEDLSDMRDRIAFAMDS